MAALVLSEELAKYLATKGLDLIVSLNLFVGLFPDAPLNVTTIRETGGALSDPDLVEYDGTTGNVNLRSDDQLVQVYTRNGKYTDAMRLQSRILNVIHQLTRPGNDLGALRVDLAMAVDVPQFVRQTPCGVEVSTNYRFIVLNPTTV